MIEIIVIFLLQTLPIIFNILFGYFDAKQTARKDYPSRTKYWVKKHYQNFENNWIELQNSYRDLIFRSNTIAGRTKFDKWDLWYVGDNIFYNPGKRETADYWHRMKFWWMDMGNVWGISLILLELTKCYMFGFQWWYIFDISYGLLFSAIEGNSFNIWYDILIPYDTDKSLKSIWYRLTHGKKF